MRRWGASRAFSFFSGLVLITPLAVVFRTAGAQTNTPATAPAKAAIDSEYVGSETCKPCLEDLYNNFENTPRWQTTLNDRGGPSKQGYEASSGSGKEHVERGGDKTTTFAFKNGSARESSERCSGGQTEMEELMRVEAL